MSRLLSLLALYRVLAQGFGLFAGLFLRWRLARGKEEPGRYAEKTGWPGKARPVGRLAWLHGASVGEALALLPLAGRLTCRGFAVLLTTGTVSSARIMHERLGAGALHQYAPLDVPRFVARFLDHWRPDIVLLAESEIWPNILCEVHRRNIPVVLVNARISARSYRRWQRLPATITALLGRIDLCLAQTQEDGTRLLRLGAPRVQVSGNLKYDVPAPPVDSAALARLVADIGARPVWLAVSTHPGEENLIGDVHLALLGRFPALLTLIVPRHSDRGPEVANDLMRKGLNVQLRSLVQGIGPDINVYVADTMGETGLFYRLTTIVFVGKSLAAGPGGGGGQNPIEPAKLGAAILHGPLVDNFAQVYASLDAARGGAIVTDATTLAQALQVMLCETGRLREMARAAQEAVAGLGGATDRIMAAIEPYLLQITLDQR